MQAPVRGFIAGVPKASASSSSREVPSKASTTSPAPHFDPDFSFMRHVVTVAKPDNNHPAASITAQLVIATVYTITLLLITRYSIDPAITYFRSSV
ncbi:hypothetical protein D0859_08603 [Hortaea werneckii]|uniref:Uncharacterized protein n=1 Tax=Hortaea werneckii TaxID=91943 RepID=A0A3M7IPQ0_HORWE|nr:hypothetical protein D0859_08603 [Hortaea werneckii]